jgi:tetratricopeptide (TPR) repeat protein
MLYAGAAVLANRPARFPNFSSMLISITNRLSRKIRSVGYGPHGLLLPVLFSHSSDMTDSSPDKLYDAACKLKDQGNLQGCVEALLSILQNHPDHLQTHLALGVHLQKLGRHDEAITHAKRVAELNPQDAFSFTQLSVIYQRCGKIFEAEEAMARAREIQGHVHRH